MSKLNLCWSVKGLCSLLALILLNEVVISAPPSPLSSSSRSLSPSSSPRSVKPTTDHQFRLGKAKENLKNAAHNVGVGAAFGVGNIASGAVGTAGSAVAASQKFSQGKGREGMREATRIVTRPIDGALSGTARVAHHGLLATGQVAKAAKEVCGAACDKIRYKGEKASASSERHMENGKKLMQIKQRGKEERQDYRSKVVRDAKYLSGVSNKNPYDEKFYRKMFKSDK